MITEINAVNLRQHLGELLNRVHDRKDSIVVSKNGRPVAVLVDVELFGRIRRMRERFDAFSDRIAEACATVPEADGVAEIDAAVTTVRQR
ncbi:MAG TPA: type II toxin-antitoxin system Phd/YefM family antitoxin [Ottowia sp.]|nr:type II toxin-antitoxin system Phd/YefM family antitoxin [Ottowia sp.]